MPLTNIEFQSYAGRIIPEYDGSPAELLRFIDALELVAENVETYEATAVKLIKTKLKGKARSLIINEKSIMEIIETLKTQIKSESSESIIGKIMNVKSINKSSNSYVKELEDLSIMLKRAYITEGTTLPLAEKYTTQQLVTSLKSNTHNSEVKTVMRAGTYNTVQEALTKYSQVTSEKDNVTINYYKGNKFRNNFRDFRGRFPENKSHNYNNNNYRYNNNKWRGIRFNYKRNNNRHFQEGNQQALQLAQNQIQLEEDNAK